jgi:gliding motility-associated-like protein
VTGTQPIKPTVLCYETATWNPSTCVWDVTGTQPIKPTVLCYETATWNPTTCIWDVTGTQPIKPTVLCYETATWNPSTCVWDVTGTQPIKPTVLCYETATWNPSTCVWDVTGTQPVKPTVLCYETATWNPSTCVWDVTGTQPIKPSVLCYETATWNPSTCVWDVTGTQPIKPTVLCYETATWNPSTCVWDVTGTQPIKPTILCYETATWNPSTCVWDVTGTQPVKPTVLCYETATWNPATCIWDVTGTQPIKPTVLCYETATWNPSTCVWDVTGTQPIKPTVLCYETATWNPSTCVWDVTGTQPIKPTVLCYETATWNPSTCVWDVTVNGTIPNANAGEDITINCTTNSKALSASGGVSYSWSPATGLSATNIANPIASPTVTTTYTVTVTAENGCTASDSVVVSVINLIVANDDAGTAVNGFNGGISFSNVLINDLLNCKAVKAEEVTISFVSSTNPGISLNGTNVVVAAGTPAGNYTLTYQICEKLNPTNCDTAIVTITVTAPIIVAQDDTIAGGNGIAGNSNAGNVLNNNGNGNDTLNGVNVTIAQVNLTVTTPATPIGGGPVPSINSSTGQVSVPAGTPAGTYTIVYQICEKLNPSNCDSAIVTITVTAPIVANDDSFVDIDGTTGNSNVGNVLINNGNGNDTLNGVAVTIDQVNLTVTTPATSIGGGPVPIVDITTGQISVPAGTPAGTYTIIYQICEKINPTNCDSAIVTIEVGEVFGENCEVIVVHKALTPNYDDKNDYLHIDGVEDSVCYPSGINIEIYNRWGVLVFETTKYNNESNRFDGFSKGRTTISKSDGLPTGTYFYILNYESFDGNGNIKINKKDGFIYLSR